MTPARDDGAVAEEEGKELDPGAGDHPGSFDPGLETGYLRRAPRDHELPLDAGAAPFDPGPQVGYDRKRARRKAKGRARKDEGRDGEAVALREPEELESSEDERRESEAPERSQLERAEQERAEQERAERERQARLERERAEREEAERRERRARGLEELERQALLDEERRERERAERLMREEREREERRAEELERRARIEWEREERARAERERRESKRAERRRRWLEERNRIERERRERRRLRRERRARAKRRRAARRAAQRQRVRERGAEARKRMSKQVAGARGRVHHKGTTRPGPSPRLVRTSPALARPTAKAGLALAAVTAAAIGLGAALGLPLPGLDSGKNLAASLTGIPDVGTGTSAGLTRGPFFPVLAPGPPDYGEGGARYGASRGGRRHEGQDIFGRSGTPLVAVRDGIVVDGNGGKSFYSYGGGNTLVIYSPVDNRSYVYLHMLKPALVPAGAQVQAGQIVGQLGCTGSCYGPHLHFEIRIGQVGYGVERKAVDPLPLLQQWPQTSLQQALAEPK